jgi:hypothetical protein
MIIKWVVFSNKKKEKEMAAKITPEKKTKSEKAVATARKPAARKKYDKGEALVCDVCGLAVTVDALGDYAYTEESALLCCGAPMKAKARKTSGTAKTSKSKAAKK